MSDRLGEMLVKALLINDQQLKTALDTQRELGGKLSTILVKLRFVNEDKLVSFLAKELNLPALSIKELAVSPKVSALMDVEIIEKHMILPISRTEDTLSVATADPMEYEALDEVHFLTNLKVKVAVASRSNIQKAIDFYFHGRVCKELQEAEGGAPPKAAPGAQAPSQVAVLKSLVELLIEKKVFTKEELLAKVNAKSGK
jgi:type IV pilus assembly protein PilB